MGLRNLIRFLLGLSVVTAFISGPMVSLGVIDIRAFDFVFIFLIITVALYLETRSKLFLPRMNFLWGPSALYFILVIILPVFGIVVYNNPLGYFVGDLRWLQVLFVGISFLIVYEDNIREFTWDFSVTIKAIVVLHLFFFFLQYLDLSGIVSTKPILSIWYHGVSQYGEYGYRFGRFSGASVNVSTLGFSAAVAVAVFGRSAITDREGFPFLIIAIFLLIASGTRTAIIATVGVIGILVLFGFISNNSLEIQISHIAVAMSALIATFPIMWYFNIGRLASSDRYNEIIELLLSPGKFLAISGRGKHWPTALARVENYPLGTLSNPRWVFHDVTVVDSYFIITYMQGSYILLFSYILFLFIIIILSINIVIFRDEAIITAAFANIIIIHSITQNVMLGMSGKILLVLCVVILTVVYSSADTHIYSEDSTVGTA